LENNVDFSLTEEQTRVVELASKVFGDQTTNEHLRVIEAQELRFDTKLWDDLAATGLLGVGIGEAYGGMGMGFETLSLVIEQAGNTLAPVPLIANLVSAALTIEQFASEELKTEILPAVASGKTIITAALSEGHIDNPSATSMVLEGGLLSGTKHLVPFAAQSAKILLSAKSENGLALLLVDTNSNGVTLVPQITTTGEPQYSVNFDKVAVETGNILGHADEAIAMINSLNRHTLAANCSYSTGLLDAMVAMTAKYTIEREQFGVPIATFQAVSHRAADCYRCRKPALGDSAISNFDESR
jgi:alkylation response protein AidB-like acyl-CoA dehydrogenase